MTTCTERLRKLLDEREVEHIDNDDERDEATEPLTTTWEYTQCGYEMVVTATEVRDTENKPYLDMDFHHYFTPEQAIAATLGSGECVPHGEWESISQTQEVRHVFCDCGYELGMDECDSWPFRSTRLFAMPNYCQECGRKIRKAVKR